VRALLRHPVVRAAAVRIAVLGVLVAAAIGLRARSPMGADDQPWRLSAVNSSVVLSFIVALTVVCLAVAVLNRGGQASRGRPARRNSLLSFLVLLAFLALAWFVQRAFHHESSAPPRAAPTGSPAPPARSVGGSQHATSSTGLGVLLLLGLLAIVVAVVVAVRRQPPPAPDELTDALSEALSEGLAAAAGVLNARRHDAAPRERVVLAYAAFEQALAERGVVRGTSGTPTALLRQAVEAGAAPEPAAELTDLFSKARFSLEDVSEQDVLIAERALDTLLDKR
jgi:hypothetical protein